MGSRNEAVKHYKKYEIKWKKYLKSLKKHNKMVFVITNKSGSCCELRKINKIRGKASKKHCNSIRGSSSDKLDSNSSLSRKIYWDTPGQPVGHKEMNILDHVAIYNINANKDQLY